MSGYNSSFSRLNISKKYLDESPTLAVNGVVANASNVKVNNSVRAVSALSSDEFNIVPKEWTMSIGVSSVDRIILTYRKSHKIVWVVGVPQIQTSMY